MIRRYGLYEGRKEDGKREKKREASGDKAGRIGLLKQVSQGGGLNDHEGCTRGRSKSQPSKQFVAYKCRRFPALPGGGAGFLVVSLAQTKRHRELPTDPSWATMLWRSHSTRSTPLHSAKYIALLVGPPVPASH